MLTLLFDVDDTLYDQLIPFEAAYRTNFPHLCHLPIEQLYQANRKFSDAVFEKTISGEMGLREMHIYRISQAFAQFDIHIRPEEALAFQLDYEANQKKICVTADAKRTIELCYEHGIRLGVITNGPAAHQQNKVEQLGIKKWIPQQYIYISGALQMVKPDLRLFRHVESAMGLVPEHTYYIGDSYHNDVVGAGNAGWKTIWINRRKQQLPDGAFKPDFIVDGHTTLFEIVEQLCAVLTNAAWESGI